MKNNLHHQLPRDRFGDNPGPDDRLLIVAVTENDIRKFGWPLPDEELHMVVGLFRQESSCQSIFRKIYCLRIRENAIAIYIQV